MRKITLILTLVLSFVVHSQTYPIKIYGTVVSLEDDVPLESATVFLQKEKDSTVVTYTITNQKGAFVLEDKLFDPNVTLFVSSIGYETYSKKIDVINASNLDLKTLLMAPADNTLDEVVVRAVAPITIKKDTLEFNVKSFRTKKDATVEDLLRELPGVEVDDDGKILVNGKEVSKILVNGKPFFGDDPTITTRNLTKDIIEKVQITDSKTKSEAFSGEEGDQENKTINLTIKEENNKGTFGRLAGGLGTDKRFEFAGIVNKFDNERRLSVLSGGNNINSPGFSFGEIQKMFGGGQSVYMNGNGSFNIGGRAFGGGEGIIRSRNIGANYADKFGKKVDLTSDFFYAASNSDNNSTISRENILPDIRYFTSSNSNASTNSDSYAANVALDIAIDSTFLVNVRPSFRKSKVISRNANTSSSLDENNVLTNAALSASNQESKGQNFRNTVDLTKRFGANGAFIKWSMTNENNTTETENFLNSETNIYGTNASTISRDQFTDGEQTLNSFSSRFSYRLPLISKEFFLDFTYSLRSDTRNSVASTFDFDPVSQEYNLFNTDLSTDFIYENRRSTPGLKLSYTKEKYRLTVNGGYVFRTLENEDQLRPTLSLKRNFEAIELGSNFNIRFNPKTSMYFGYSLNNAPPDLAQLQPFQDVSDPLNTVTGNPDLKPMNTHSVYMGFNNFNFQKGNGFYSYLNVNVPSNQVVSKTSVDDDFVSNTTYENVNGNYAFNVGGNYNKTIKVDSLRTLKLSIGTWSNFNKNINFNNEVQYASKTSSVSPNASITLNWKKVLEFRPSYSVSFSKTSFDLDDFENQKFVNHTLRLRTSTFLPKNLEWRNDLRYNYNPNVAEGFQKSAWLWNTTLAYTVLKNAGTINVKVFDLLGQNTNARRSASADYIQDSQSTVLQQYVMFGFSWKFNSLGKKGEVSSDPFYFD